MAERPEDLPPDAAEIVKLLAATERLRVVAALVLGAATTDDVVAASSLPSRTVLAALARLESGGLVERGPGGTWMLLTERFADARPASPPPEAASYDGVPPEAAAVLQRFFRGEKLLSVPTQRAKRLVVLEHLAGMFDVGVRYSEKEVSERLAQVYDDYAALRRYLVDEGLLSRDAGIYWRSGGPVEL